MLQSENASIMQRLAKYIVHVFRARVDHDTVNIVIPSTCIIIKLDLIMYRYWYQWSIKSSIINNRKWTYH